MSTASSPDIIINQSDEPKWINIRKWKATPIMSWRGIDCGDGKYRLHQRIPPHTQKKTKHRRGRLMSSFTKLNLIEISWKLGVPDPNSFDRSDCDFLGIPDDQGFQHYLMGWKNTNKKELMNYIWNHLHDIDEIYHLQ